MRPRLAIGPANYAGQAYAWAEAINVHLDADAVAITADTLHGSAYSFASHRRIPKATFATASEIAELLADPARCAAMGRRGREAVATTFDFGREAAALVGLTHRLVGR